MELQKFERLALKEGQAGKTYVYDLTKRSNCNKTEIQYLGIVRTENGKRFKILTSFFVFSTGADMCHGTSRIKVFDMNNKYIGQYYVGMPEELPDYLKNNKLCYSSNFENCNLRKERIIDLSKGLPKSFFISCTKNGGNFYSFSGE